MARHLATLTPVRVVQALAAVLLLAGLIVPTAAHGQPAPTATVRAIAGAGGPFNLQYEAGAGQANDLTVSATFEACPDNTCDLHHWTLREEGTAASTGTRVQLVGTGPDCTNVDPYTVQCTHDLYDGYGELLDLRFGDVNDQAQVPTVCGEDSRVTDDNRCIARVYGGSGNDRVEGRNDYRYYGADLDVQPITQVYGEAGDDTLFGHLLYGGDGNDTLVASAKNDRIEGGRGNDKLSGGEGKDILYGDTGNDHVTAGSGDDVAAGGYGNDEVYLGYGNDRAYMRDDWRDYVGGGPGTDRARSDPKDTRRNMEGTF